MTPNDPSLTIYEQKIAHLREVHDAKIEALRDIVALKVTEGDKALRLQAEEYERRLAALNHEQARLAADRERFLPRDSFDVFIKDMDVWKATVNRFMASTAGRETGIGTSWSILVAVGGLAVAGGCAGLSLLITVSLFLINRT